ncbi:hypothetical protein ACFGVS_30055 [Mucilaginibacter sp. AW1-7]|jgi:hypothetical protein|uniref:hypothetical protein n=1 Tax=unclassified Mucilaginibacter TaxID=2617802 RepID=UPI0008D89B75|nr:hypothetical protein [Mucilaginibacter sp. OK283]SEO70688.1 hypothetical protein SAMN05428947_103488 [Mucilaginibacter sp. OK283]
MKPKNDQQDNRLFAMQQVIKKLRNDDLNQGHCFMIFDDELPDDEAYYEYPDGQIKVERLDKSNLDAPREVIKVLTKSEIAAVKEKHEVFH